MSQIINNTSNYSIVTQRELAVLLAAFETSYIYNVIQTNLANKYDTNFLNNLKPNVIGSFEMNFKNLLTAYPMDHENINFTRQQTYEEIIDILSNEYQFRLADSSQDILDKYTLAYFMYDLLVSKFTNYITFFFADYLIREKDNIYSAFNLDAIKKNKDSSTLYGKRAYDDSKIAIINANLLMILQGMTTFDISFTDICRSIYPDTNISNLLSQNLIPTVDFYKVYYCAAIGNPQLTPGFLTSVRLEIQRRQGM